MKSFYYILFSIGALHILGLYTFSVDSQSQFRPMLNNVVGNRKPNNKKMGKIEKVFCCNIVGTYIYLVVNQYLSSFS